MSKHNYKFYIQRMIWVETEKDKFTTKKYPYSNAIDIESNYDALYSECKGINTLGEPKNTYTEEYADNNALRTFVPEKVYRKATDVELVLYFLGEKRYENYHRLVSDLSQRGNGEKAKVQNSIWRYWDTARKRGFDFVFIDSTKLDEDVLKGNLPYIKVSLNLKNIYGESSTEYKIYPNENY